jgi:hypothetical protein
MTLIYILQTLGVSHTNLLPKLLKVHAQLAIAQALQQVLWQFVLEGNIRISVCVLRWRLQLFNRHLRTRKEEDQLVFHQTAGGKTLMLERCLLG